MPILHHPANDGDPEIGFEHSGFKDWHWGAVYTVRPAKQLPHRLMVAVRKKDASFAEVYSRAAMLTAACVADLGLVPVTIAHAWGRHEGAVRFTFASIGSEIGANHSEGLAQPTAAELSAPGGTVPSSSPTTQFQEIYNDFDFRGEASTTTAMFSYGEYVESSAGLDFEPILARAEDRARRHHRSLPDCAPFRVLRREWLLVEDVKLAVVHIYFPA